MIEIIDYILRLLRLTFYLTLSYTPAIPLKNAFKTIQPMVIDSSTYSLTYLMKTALPFTKHFPIPQLYPSNTLLKYDDRNHRLYPSHIWWKTWFTTLNLLLNTFLFPSYTPLKLLNVWWSKSSTISSDYFALPFTKLFPIPSLYPSKTRLKQHNLWWSNSSTISSITSLHLLLNSFL